MIRRRRRYVAALQGVTLIARRGGWWRVNDYCRRITPMEVGCFENFRIIISPSIQSLMAG